MSGMASPRYHLNPRVNELVQMLLHADFDRASNPYRPVGAPLPSPLTFGQTLLAVADRFGEDVAIHVNLLKH